MAPYDELKISPTAHERNVRQLRCVVSGTNVLITVHHCHSGSMSDNGWHRGLSQKSNPYLIIPLTADYHVGRWNPEQMGIRTWESNFGTQMDHLREVSDELGYDVFTLARNYAERH